MRGDLPPWGSGITGTLAARGGAPSTEPLPCVLPPQTGFRSLENQLYRVEIHTDGGYGGATFKWSRENGSVIAGIVSQLTGSYSSPTFNVRRSAATRRSVSPGDWVELIDDHSEFQTGVGELLQVGTVDAANQTISLQAAPTLTVDATLHPKLRRWDQTQNAGATGVPIVDGSWIELENGVQIQFSNEQFEVGDYWLIPARTATSNQTVGTVEWPIDSSTDAPAFEPPRGIVHYYAKLAIVAFDGQQFAPPQGSGAVTDCRIFFPPLTDIATQESPCTLVLRPGSDWVGKINALFTASPALDAELCFAIGAFSATQPVIIATTGNVKVSGAGWGTSLVGTGIESVLQFHGCATAIVRDLYASASTVDAPPDAPTTKASRVIHGALDFISCGEVLVENVSLQCGAALLPGAACLVVRSDATLNVHDRNRRRARSRIDLRGRRDAIRQSCSYINSALLSSAIGSRRCRHRGSGGRKSCNSRYFNNNSCTCYSATLLSFRRHPRRRRPPQPECGRWPPRERKLRRKPLDRHQKSLRQQPVLVPA